MRFTRNLLLPTTFTLKPRMRQPAGVAEILRSHQKDDIYTGYLKNAVSEVFQEIFGKYLEPQKFLIANVSVVTCTKEKG